MWDGVTWEQQHPKQSPAARFSAGAAYSKARNAVVVFGGQDIGDKQLNDTWFWDGKTWTKDKSKPVVPPRVAPGMTSYGRQVVLFSGYQYDGMAGTYYADTWVLAAKGWRLRAQGPTSSPSARTATTMAYDSTRHRVLLFGGFKDDLLGGTWALKGD